MKSALRIYLSVSYVMKSITSISHLRWLFPPLGPYGTTFPPRWEGGGASRQRRYKKWRRRRRTSPVGTVSQPIGKPFNGQAKGLLWLTWRSYAGPPQYYIPPEGGALNPPVRRSRSQAEPWQPRADRPGGCLNPHARKGVSTFGNTATRRSCGTKAKKIPGLLRGFFHWFQASISTVSGLPASSRPR